MEFTFILQCLWFFLPAYVANMAPPIAAHFGILEFLNKPVDFGKKFFDKEILGSHKTWRGLIVGVCAGFATYFIQVLLYKKSDFFASVSILDYQNINPWLFGILIPLGALCGDMIFSFFKRQLNIAPGESWMPFDQTDYVFGVMIFTAPFLNFEIRFWIWLLFLTFVLHILCNKLGYWLKISKSEW